MSDTDKIREVFAAIRNDLGPVDVLVYSASSRFKAQGSQGNIEVCTERDMERAWKIDTLGNWAGNTFFGRLSMASQIA